MCHLSLFPTVTPPASFLNPQCLRIATEDFSLEKGLSHYQSLIKLWLIGADPWTEVRPTMSGWCLRGSCGCCGLSVCSWTVERLTDCHHHGTDYALLSVSHTSQSSLKIDRRDYCPSRPRPQSNLPSALSHRADFPFLVAFWWHLVSCVF